MVEEGKDVCLDGAEHALLKKLWDAKPCPQCLVLQQASPIKQELQTNFNSSIVKEPAKNQEKNLFDMQAKNMLTELQTTKRSAIKIILFQRWTQQLFFSLRWPEHPATESRGKNEPYMDIPFSSEKICPPVLSAPHCSSQFLFRQLTEWDRKELFKMSTECTNRAQQFIFRDRRT